MSFTIGTYTFFKRSPTFFSFIGKILKGKKEVHGKKISTEKTCAMHYHYDLHGNVQTLLQDNAGLSIPAQRYKRIDYEYDLISGKVNAVHYQDNQPDQFHHKYEYDADNRITDVYTSKDKILWDHDAKYFYYPHGPLARIEYGDNHVQGMDYAYTLQGWVKGINSETLDPTRDMGHDGNVANGNVNQHFAKDAVGYSLTYFEGDYQPIGTTSFLANKQNSDLLKNRNDLFNGNISAMVTSITNPLTGEVLPQGTAYKYDQLNRLLESKAFANIDAASNAWGSGLTYAEDEFNITPRLNANIGIRYSGFYVNQHFYKSLQPRLSVNYLITKNTSIKASFATMEQYVHLLSNSGFELPTDLWVPATENVLPQSSQQVALGFIKNIASGINLTMEGFYKKMNNIVEYKDGASYLTSNVSWENKVESGKGWSYGGEFMMKKSTGKITGWLAYTLSWSNRQFDKINFGKVFPYKYDRRHDLSFTCSYKLNEKINISGTWVFGTGLAITIPTDVYQSPYGGSNWYFTDRNSFRMPPYHRLDLSIQFHKKKKWGERSWNISVYNAYNRLNPYYITSAGVHSYGGNYQIVTLFPILPSISYSFKF